MRRAPLYALYARGRDLPVGQRRRAGRDPLVRAHDDRERDADGPRRLLQLPADRARRRSSAESSSTVSGSGRRASSRTSRAPAPSPRSRCCTRRSGSSSGSSWRSCSSARCWTRPERPRAQRSSPTSSSRPGCRWSVPAASAREFSRAPRSWVRRSGACSSRRSAPPAPSGSTPPASCSRLRSWSSSCRGRTPTERPRSAAASSQSWPRECGSSGTSGSRAPSSRWSCSRT